MTLKSCISIFTVRLLSSIENRMFLSWTTYISNRRISDTFINIIKNYRMKHLIKQAFLRLIMIITTLYSIYTACDYSPNPLCHQLFFNFGQYAQGWHNTGTTQAQCIEIQLRSGWSWGFPQDGCDHWEIFEHFKIFSMLATRSQPFWGIPIDQRAHNPATSWSQRSHCLVPALRQLWALFVPGLCLACATVATIANGLRIYEIWMTSIGTKLSQPNRKQCKCIFSFLWPRASINLFSLCWDMLNFQHF